MAGGWGILNRWLNDYIKSENFPMLFELIEVRIYSLFSFERYLIFSKCLINMWRMLLSLSIRKHRLTQKVNLPAFFLLTGVDRSIDLSEEKTQQSIKFYGGLPFLTPTLLITPNIHRDTVDEFWPLTTGKTVGIIIYPIWKICNFVLSSVFPVLNNNKAVTVLKFQNAY